MQNGDAFLKAYEVLQSLEQNERKPRFLRRSFGFGRRAWPVNLAGFVGILRNWSFNLRTIAVYPRAAMRPGFGLRPHALPLGRFAVPAAVAAISVLLAGIWEHSGWQGYKNQNVAVLPPGQDTSTSLKTPKAAISKTEVSTNAVASSTVERHPGLIGEARKPEELLMSKIDNPAQLPSTPLDTPSKPVDSHVFERSTPISKTDSTAREWERIKDSHKIVEFQDFLRRFPSSPHAAEAIQMSEQLRWSAIDKQNLNAVRAYLDENPQGRYRVEARQQLGTLLQQQRVLQARAEEEHAWNLVNPKAEDSIQHFLAQFPTGNHASAAQELLNRLTKQEQERTLAMADENAWSKVAWRDRHSLEQYVNQFPSGKHTDQARQLLVTLATPTVTAALPAVDSREAIAVVATLKKYSDAWTAKDLDDITALRPGLGRKLAKQELSSARSIVMRIHPTSAPSIEGDRATVECIHQVDEVFTDGTEKQNHGMRMTYVLVKRGGSWLIADSR